jgi:hypothetical protein
LKINTQPLRSPTGKLGLHGASPVPASRVHDATPVPSGPAKPKRDVSDCRARESGEVVSVHIDMIELPQTGKVADVHLDPIETAPSGKVADVHLDPIETARQGKVALGDLINKFEGGFKDGKMPLATFEQLKKQAAAIPDPAFRGFAKDALNLFSAHSTIGQDGKLEPKSGYVKDILCSERLDLVATRIAEGRSHKVLNQIADPRARAQMGEFLARYMSDPVFLAVHDGRLINRGTLTNLSQSIKTLATDRKLADGTMDGVFGSCTESTARMREAFASFKADYEADPSNAGKPLPISLGGMRTLNAVGFEHNFTFAKTDQGETFYLDPWGPQDPNKDTITPKKDYIDGLKRGVGLGVGSGMITWVSEGGTEVYNPGQSNAAF